MFLFMLTPGFLVFSLLYLVVGYAYALNTIHARGALDHLRILFTTFAWPFILVRRLFT